MGSQPKSIEVEGIEVVWGWDDLPEWTGKIPMPSWAGYQYRRFKPKPEAHFVSPAEAARGIVGVSISFSGMTYRPINETETTTLKWLRENHSLACDSIVNRLYSTCADWKKSLIENHIRPKSVF
jgi:hypothetical protein